MKMYPSLHVKYYSKYFNQCYLVPSSAQCHNISHGKIFFGIDCDGIDTMSFVNTFWLGETYLMQLSYHFKSMTGVARCPSFIREKPGENPFTQKFAMCIAVTRGKHVARALVYMFASKVTTMAQVPNGGGMALLKGRRWPIAIGLMRRAISQANRKGECVQVSDNPYQTVLKDLLCEEPFFRRANC